MSPVSQWEWRTALTSPPSLYFDLMEGVPLSVLTGWLTGESTGGEVFVRRLALAASRGQVFLYYQDEESGQFYAGPVDVISVSRAGVRCLRPVGQRAPVLPLRRRGTASCLPTPC